MADEFRWDVKDMCGTIGVRIRSAIRNVDDMSEQFRMVEARFIEYMDEMFDTEGASALGHAWPELTEKYLAWKRMHGKPEQIGVLEGGLRSSLTGGAGYMSRVTPSEAYFGQIPGAVDHTDGFQHARNGTERPIVINRVAAAQWMDLMKQVVASDVEPMTRADAYSGSIPRHRVSKRVDKAGRISYRDPKTGRFASKKAAGWFK
jgi:hypothetical protein